jgi:hypothetical protein
LVSGAQYSLLDEPSDCLSDFVVSGHVGHPQVRLYYPPFS